ncbi:PREDICTED: RAD51-associated protein 1 isoform X1 [Cyprinodon variegatus]|uniref:RAD51-associated protein 1 isoform X1 n=1 Tax=Cyprinodon variegatus TaxID=28743 RepID=UPI0007427117|nr:PREDICTED: RAD51-associated protein 1 isoform X1 [Cyprinodon variegatus]
MDRPSRKSKVVNYCEFKDLDDDEDFACSKAPPSKKPREEIRQEQKKSSGRSSSQDKNPKSDQSEKSRKPLDEKLYERDLEAAITLSLLNNSDGLKESPNMEVKVQSPIDENTDPASLLLSNCSVDGAVLGLDDITVEKGSPAALKLRKTSPRSSEVQRKKDEDEDYRPKQAADSESDEDFNESAESEDEEFTVKKASKAKRKEKVTKKDKTKPSPASRTEKKQSRVSQSKPPAAAVSTLGRSPPAAKLAPSRPSSLSTASTVKPVSSLSPAGGRIPKWNPPAQIGKSPNSSQTPAVKSPSAGLRLGLSRLVRVKPLHPSLATH